MAIAGGCASPRDEFIGNRALDACSDAWPVCSTVVGCLLGAQSYVEGRFPGDARFIIQVAEPSNVYVSVYLENVSAAGQETAISWYEDRCRSRIREAVDGETFVGEAERVGSFLRVARVTGLGDHLIEIHSDAEADFLGKVDVVPTRLETIQPGPGHQLR